MKRTIAGSLMLLLAGALLFASGAQEGKATKPGVAVSPPGQFPIVKEKLTLTGFIPSVGFIQDMKTTIILMSDSKRELEREVRSAGEMTRAYFFQNLLRGSYKNREAFDEDRRLFRVEFSDAPYYVVVARLAALHAVGEGAAYALLRNAFREAAARRIGAWDFVVPVSFDDVAVVKSRDAARSFREDAVSFVEGVRSDLNLEMRGGFSFGIGTPAGDPFLLVISHNEAVTALSAAATGSNEALRFYEDLPKVRSSYSYPLDVEENVARAVRAGNGEMLDSLLRTIEEENFVLRRLSAAHARNLVVELQGTALRLLNDLAEETPAIRAAIDGLGEGEAIPENLDEPREVPHALVGAYNRAKRSHNATLRESLENYVASSYSRPDLGLTVIADAFGISENYLSSFYKEQTGERLSAAIQRIRFREAARLLLQTEDPVDTVAAKCGYANASSFRRAFKRWNALSPSEFRRRGGRAGTG